MNTDYVKMEKHVCVVCGHTYDTGAILLHKQLRSIKEDVTGNGLCPDDQKKFNDGYIALVAVSNKGTSNTLKQEEAYRTGTIIHMKEEVFFNMVQQTPPSPRLPLVFIEEKVVELIKNMMPK